MNSQSMPNLTFGSAAGDISLMQSKLWLHLYANRDSWATVGAVALGGVIVAVVQLLSLASSAELRTPTTVDLVELPPPVTTQPPAPLPAPRPVMKSMPTQPQQVQQIAVARAPLPETAQTVSVPETPPEMPNTKASPVVPIAESVKAIETPVRPVSEATPAPRSNPAAEGSYQSGARAGIERQKRYPEEALQMNMSGAVTVVYAISREGRLIRVEVEKSSGFSLLDRAALDAVKRARFDPIPADAWIGAKEQTFRTRIEFSMN